MEEQPSYLIPTDADALDATRSLSTTTILDQDAATELGLHTERRREFLLAVTLGHLKPKERSGDTDYVEWLVRFSDSHEVPCARLQVDKGGNKVDKTEMSKLVDQLDTFLSTNEDGPSDVILNWHIRFTGAPNAWTGRGMDISLIRELDRVCKQSGKTLNIIYTVHETRAVTIESLPKALGVIALNPETEKYLRKIVTVPICISRVPNLMETYQSKIMDNIKIYLDSASISTAPLSQTESQRLTDYVLAAASIFLRDTYAGMLPQESEDSKKEKDDTVEKPKIKPVLSIYRCGANDEPSKWEDSTIYTHRGILIFGLIDGRHLNVNSVRALCRAMNQHKSLEGLKILIVGKENNAKVVSGLKKLAREQEMNGRIQFIGEVHSLDNAPLVQYAISFDKDGFRYNASAQVNEIRTGCLLIIKKKDEADEVVAERAAKIMNWCEREDGKKYLHVLMVQQQKLARQVASDLVGTELLDIFDQLLLRKKYETLIFGGEEEDLISGEEEEEKTTGKEKKEEYTKGEDAYRRRKRGSSEEKEKRGSSEEKEKRGSSEEKEEYQKGDDADRKRKKGSS